MPQRDARHTLAKLRQLLDELDADLAEQNGLESAAECSDAKDEEERYVAERVAKQIAKLRTKSVPRSPHGLECRQRRIHHSQGTAPGRARSKQDGRPQP